ncbi:MAG: glycosyltransferase family protein [Ignavibacteria bacterium]|nr:glycosyltransferase family protein [Ignavibacteria bacterium]
MKTVIIVQARTGSSRLPGKVLLPLAGKPLLQRQLERIMAAATVTRLVVATTTEAEDEPVRALCQKLHVPCYNGHPTDLLDRHYRVALAEQADAVVKIPSDCPLIDPDVIDRVLRKWDGDHGEIDYLSNLHPATYPDGNDVEVLHVSILETAWQEATRQFEREHTTPFIWERPERFTVRNVPWETGRDFSMTHRWTIDYPEDYQFISRVYDELWSAETPMFHLSDILNLLEMKPEIMRLNARYAGINWYRHHRGELRTVSPGETRVLPEEQ